MGKRWALSVACAAAVGCGGVFSTDVPNEGSESGDGPNGPLDQSAFGAPCDNNDDCDSNLVCVEGACAPCNCFPEGQRCELSGECDEGLYCAYEGNTGTCSPAGSVAAGGRCTDAGDCQGGLVCELAGLASICTEASGDKYLGEECLNTSECLAGLVCREEALGMGITKCFAPSNVIPVLPPMWEGVQCPSDTGAARAYFEVPRGSDVDRDFYRLPFPNDIRRTDTGVDLSGHPTPGDLLGVGVDMVQAYVDALADGTDGFATNPTVYFRFTEKYDGASITGETVQLFDITPGSYASLSRRWGTSSGSVTNYVCENWLNVRSATAQPLRPGHTYAAILTRGVLPKDSPEFRRDDDFDAMLGGSAPSDPVLAAAYDAYAPLRAFVADDALNTDLRTAVGSGGDNILNAAVFTTQSIGLIEKLHTAVQAGPLATVSDLTLCDAGVTSPCEDIASGRVCDASAATPYHEVHGRIELPRYQNGTLPYLNVADGGGIRLNGEGNPQVVDTQQACFALTIPKGQAPEGGFGMLIYAHGTNGSFKSAISNRIAEAVAGDARSATMTIDLPMHGDRRGGSNRGQDELFFNFLNPAAARGNVAQGSADLSSVVRWAIEGDLSAVASLVGQAADIDSSRVAMMGHSQGATHASLLLPYENEVIGAVLSGVGANLSIALTKKRAPVDIAAAVPVVLFDPEAAAPELCALPGQERPTCLGFKHPVLAIVQSYFDEVDPLNYVRMLSAPAEGQVEKHLFMTFGLEDSFVPDDTQSIFAERAVLPHVGPQLQMIDSVRTPMAPWSGDTAPTTQGVRQYQPRDGQDGHFVAFDADVAEPDVHRFLTGLLTGERPVIGE